MEFEERTSAIIPGLPPPREPRSADALTPLFSVPFALFLKTEPFAQPSFLDATSFWSSRKFSRSGPAEKSNNEPPLVHLLRPHSSRAAIAQRPPSLPFHHGPTFSRWMHRSL